jgi:hypothetical protein
VRAGARERQKIGILYVVVEGGVEHYEKKSKIPILWAEGDAVLIENRWEGGNGSEKW